MRHCRIKGLRSTSHSRRQRTVAEGTRTSCLNRLMIKIKASRRKLTKALSLSPIPAKWTASASDGELMNWTLAKIRPLSGGRLCSLSNFRQHLPDPDVNCIFSSGGGHYLFDIETLLDRRFVA